MAELIFTVDLEDWYHGIPIPRETWSRHEKRLEIGVNHLLESLDKNGAAATFFILGDAAQKHSDLIKKVSIAGHEIACHGNLHQLVYEQSIETFRQDASDAKRCIEDIVQKPVKGYRAPYFSVTDKSLWAFDVIKELGFVYDSSVSTVKTWRYGISGAPKRPYLEKKTGILEIPVSTMRVMGKELNFGGAYFRIIPFTFFKKNMSLHPKNGDPSVFYIHPWEYDPQHPFIRFKYKAMITHYWNLRSTLPKTQKLLVNQPTFTMAEYAEKLLKQCEKLPKLEWNHTKN